MPAGSIGYADPEAFATALAVAEPEPPSRTPAVVAGTVLTPGELRLLYWLATGRTNTQIAECLMRSEKTVRNQLSQLYVKLGVCNRTEAVALYLRRGWGS